MRSPINQDVVNGLSSVGAWAEASVWENQAEAFGVGVRIVPMRGTLEPSASTTAIGERTAYQFSSVEAHAQEALEVTRYAWAPAPVLHVVATESIDVTRYAWVQFPESHVNEAATWDDPDKIIAYSVAFPRTARGVALVWNNDNKTVALRTRAQYVRGARVGRAEVRLLANAIIGIGQTTGEAESTLTGLSHIQSAQASSISLATGNTTLLSRVRSAEGVAVGQGHFSFEPSVTPAGSSLRYSYNSAFPEAHASSGALLKKTTPGLLSAAVCALEGRAIGYRVHRVDGAETGEANVLGAVRSHRVHKAAGKIQVSAFTLFGPAFYHLIWADGIARPEGATQMAVRHLRWTPVNATAVAQALSGSSNSRRTPSEGLSETRGQFIGEGVVLRRMQSRPLEVRTTSQATPVRRRLGFGLMEGYAPYPPHGVVKAVRWAGHGAADGVDTFAESTGEGLRSTRSRAVVRQGRAETDASSVRTAGARGVGLLAATAVNLREPCRTAVMQGVLQGQSLGQDDDTNMHVFHWRRARGTAVLVGETKADGLREFFVSMAPLMEGNASVLRTTFKINANADAPDTRLILVGFPDRELMLPAPDREYFIQ